MKIAVITTILASAIFLSDAHSHQCEQTDRGLWSKNREFKRTMALVGGLFQCIDRSDANNYQLEDKALCYWFTGRAIESLYGIDSFRDEEGYLSSSRMAQVLHAGEAENWKKLGPVNSQETLDLVPKLTRKGIPVLAAWLGENGQGQVSLVLPGGLAYSGSWGLKVPNAANISLGALNRSFYGCRLSFALSKDKIDQAYLFSFEN